VVEPDPTPPDDEHADADVTDAAADHLSALRIRQFATARRVAYRARSYAVMATGVCIIAVVQLIWMTIRHVRASGWGKQPVGYSLFAISALIGVWYFIARAIALHREAKKSALPEPASSPDFSTLDNGSQRWKNLEDVR
jgi:hypothetical protein